MSFHFHVRMLVRHCQPRRAILSCPRVSALTMPMTYASLASVLSIIKGCTWSRFHLSSCHYTNMTMPSRPGHSVPLLLPTLLLEDGELLLSLCFFFASGRSSFSACFGL